MSFQPKHCGLYFADEHLDLARENRQREPIRSALPSLDRRSDDPLISAQLAGLRYRLFGDADDASAAIETFQQTDWSAQTKRQLLGWLSALEMLRDYPGWTSLRPSLFSAVDARLKLPPADDAAPLDDLWDGALMMAAGIVMERSAYFQRGADVYQQAIHTRIHPEGFLKGIVDVAGVTESYGLQVSGTCALVLMAEMAAHAGVDLWAVDNRGITPITATAYLLYYYFYPEQWKWESGITRAATTAVMRCQGAFIEMVNRRHALPGADHLLDDLRPMFSIDGGLTTLTHGIAPPPKKRRWPFLLSRMFHRLHNTI